MSKKQLDLVIKTITGTERDKAVSVLLSYCDICNKECSVLITYSGNDKYNPIALCLECIYDLFDRYENT